MRVEEGGAGVQPVEQDVLRPGLEPLDVVTVEPIAAQDVGARREADVDPVMREQHLLELDRIDPVEARRRPFDLDERLVDLAGEVGCFAKPCPGRLEQARDDDLPLPSGDRAAELEKA